MGVRIKDPSPPSSNRKEEEGQYHANSNQRRFAFGVGGGGNSGRRIIRRFSRRSRSVSLPVDNDIACSDNMDGPVETISPPSLLRRRIGRTSDSSSVNKKCVVISPDYDDATSTYSIASASEKEELSLSRTSHTTTSSSEEEQLLSITEFAHNRPLTRYHHEQREQPLPSPLRSRRLQHHYHQQHSHYDLMHVWLQSANNLMNCEEMKAFTSCSKELVCKATGTAIHVALLPWTFPIHVVTSTTLFVVDTVCFKHAVPTRTTATPLLLETTRTDPSDPSSSNTNEDENSPPPTKTRSSSSWLGMLQKNATQIVPLVLQTTHQIKDDVGSTVLNLVGLGDNDDSVSCSEGSNTITEKKEETNNNIDRNTSKTYRRKYRYGSYSETNDDDTSFLDRLRLDYTEDHEVEEDYDSNKQHEEQLCKSSIRSKSFNDLEDHKNDTEESLALMTTLRKGSSTSKFLLRVDDLDLWMSQQQLQQQKQDPQESPQGTSPSTSSSAHLYMVDLLLLSSSGTDSRSTNVVDNHGKLMNQTFDSLVKHALSLFNNNAECQLKHNMVSSADGPATLTTKIEWKAEGSTGKHLKKRRRMMPGIQKQDEEWKQLMEQEILIWSGKFTTSSSSSSSSLKLQPKHHGYDIPLFIARGIVPMSPRNFVKLLWDSKRTSEYNKYNLGRTDVLILEDDSPILSTSSSATATIRGSKIIKSETKVPFTSMSIKMLALMHVRPLEDGNGFVIVTRSLSSGKAGCHTTNSRKSSSPQDMDDNKKNLTKGEILWGINVLQSVPDSPNRTDLISLSQVGSSMLPGFLSKKIGIMACEDFFSEVRGKQFFK